MIQGGKTPEAQIAAKVCCVKGFASRGCTCAWSFQALEELAVDDGRGDDAGGPDGGEGLPRKRFRLTRLLLRFVTGARDHFIQLLFADDVAGAVAGLAQIQELFESDQLALRVRPAAR